MLLNNQRVIEEIIGEIKKYLGTMETEIWYHIDQSLQDAVKMVLEGRSQQYRPISRNKKNLEQSNFTLKGMRKKKNKQRLKLVEGNNKDQSMKDEIETKKTVRSVRLRAGALKR